MKIAGVEAWDTVAGNPALRWGHNLKAFDDVAYPVSYVPKFRLRADQSFFCIGSCFARNIEEHLIYRDIAVLSKQLRCPRSEWPNRANGIVNKYTTHSILNEVRWLERPLPPDPQFYLSFSEGWLDPQLSPGSKPVSLERAIARRAYLTADYFSRLAKADVVILTLGLNEAWYDEITDLHLNMTPSIKAVRAAPDRFSVEITSVAQNMDALQELRARLLCLRKGIKFVVTVSPVPMDVSFSGQDAVVANIRSKSVLRIAAEEFANANDDVDYFPGYEMVAMAPASKAFRPDHGHVTDAAVGAVIGRFLQGHDISASPAEFDERDYLAANPDVDRAVREGEWVSGFHHWRQTQAAKI